MTCLINTAEWYCPVLSFIKYLLPYITGFIFGYVIAIIYKQRQERKQ
jgi:hypothetical protein